MQWPVLISIWWVPVKPKISSFLSLWKLSSLSLSQARLLILVLVAPASSHLCPMSLTSEFNSSEKRKLFFTSCSAQGFPDVWIVSNFASPDSSWLHLGSTCWPAPVLTTGRWIYSSHVAICPVTTHSIFKISKITHMANILKVSSKFVAEKTFNTGWSYTLV